MKSRTAQATHVAVALLLPLTVLAQTKLPDSFDVVGVRMGMSPNQVRQAIKAHSPKLPIRDKSTFLASGALPGGQLAELEACGEGPAGKLAGGHGECIRVTFGRLTQEATHVSRELNSPPATVSQKAVVDSVVSKYGKPFNQIVDSPIHFAGRYDYKSTGERSAGNTGCLTGPNMPSATVRGCGLAMYVAVSGDANGMNKLFRIYATDHSRLQREIELEREMQANANRAIQEKAKALAGNGPKM